MSEAPVHEQPPRLLIKERDGGVLVARLNRPERMNALGGGLREELNATWFEFRDDPDLKVMIVTGTGERAFCTGMDLRESDQRAREIGAQSAQALLDSLRTPQIVPSLNTNNMYLYKPVIAAINGWCVAGGCEMAMGCDLRIIEEHARMGLPEVKRGMGAKATTHKLYYLTHFAAGLEIEWTGDPVSAQRAVELGYFLQAHRLLGCRGCSRSDFRWDDERGEEGLFLLETNTQPGMTPLSLVPEQARHCGIEYGELAEIVIEDALRHFGKLPAPVKAR